MNMEELKNIINKLLQQLDDKDIRVGDTITVDGIDFYCFRDENSQDDIDNKPHIIEVPSDMLFGKEE